MKLENMIDYANARIKACNDLLELSKVQKMDKILLNVNQECLDFYTTVLPMIEKAYEEEQNYVTKN